MKSDKNILIAFLLNLVFCLFELIGGAITGSVAIVSDAVHDFGDSLSIGISYFLEKLSKKAPDENYTYGYKRFSVIASTITTVILLSGSIVMIYNSVLRLINPIKINHNGMLIFAIIGTVVNLVAAIVTHRGYSMNEKSVSLHMLEDVLGWIVVLIGAIIIKFTGFVMIDPLLSLVVALFILICSIKNIKEILSIFLEKTPKGLTVQGVKNKLCKISGVEGVHHIHLWSIDGEENLATMHIVTNGDTDKIKKEVKSILLDLGINHSTIETEKLGEACGDKQCNTSEHSHTHHHHHH